MSNNKTFEINILSSLDDVNSEDDNVDVEVLWEGARYVATFFTPYNLLSIMERYQVSGECLGGRYFWAIDMIIVNSLDVATIHDTVESLISDGEFESAFSGPFDFGD